MTPWTTKELSTCIYSAMSRQLKQLAKSTEADCAYCHTQLQRICRLRKNVRMTHILKHGILSRRMSREAISIPYGEYKGADNLRQLRFIVVSSSVHYGTPHVINSHTPLSVLARYQYQL